MIAPARSTPEGAAQVAGYRARQLLVLATDALLAEIRRAAADPAGAQRMTDLRILPPHDQPRYDARFLHTFHNVVELARNHIVCDLPHLGSTAEELAGHAIITRARGLLADPGAITPEAAAGVDAGLPGQLAHDAQHIAEDLDELEAILFEDDTIAELFQAAPARVGTSSNADADPHAPLEEADLRRFEHWLVPFGSPPRPQITDAGRAVAAT